MADENPTLESLNNELQELKSKFENRNVFQEIANQLHDLIEIKTSIIPTIGSMVNEGEEFILKVNIDFNCHFNKPLNIDFFNENQFMDNYSILLGYWSNCMQKRDDSGEKIITIKDSFGGSVSDYKLHFKQSAGSGLRIFSILNLSIYNSIEIEYHLVAAETINREQLLAEVAYRNDNTILTMHGLSKKVEIGNEVIHPG